jgi:hypothetical protein
LNPSLHSGTKRPRGRCQLSPFAAANCDQRAVCSDSGGGTTNSGWQYGPITRREANQAFPSQYTDKDR